MPEETIDGIYRDGRHYDRLFTTAHQDLGFWKGLAKSHGGPILELGCGTGRVTIPLSLEGYNVTGIDQSEGMLREARRKSKEANAYIELVKADFRAFDLTEVFSLIIIPNNSLCHLLNLGDFESCLASVCRHLAPNGRFVIDVFVPKMALCVNRPGERFPFGEYEDPDGRGRIVVTESYVYEPDTQIKRVKTCHAIPGVAGEIEGKLDLRMYFPQELDALIKYNGFTIENKFGSYDQTAFDSKSEKQLVVCRIARKDDGFLLSG